MTISVVVPAFRAEATIGACLEALFEAGFTRGDVVVVDDGSPDGTAEAVRGKGIEPGTSGGNQGAAEARNAGVGAARGDIIFFVDSDVLVHRDVRERLETFFARHPDHAGVFGSYDDAPAAPRAVSRIRNLLHHYIHQRAAGPASTFWTGCGALRKADFEAGGGFRREDEMIEDVGLGLRIARLGRPITLDPGLRCTHLKDWTWSGFAMTDYRGRAIPWTRMMCDPANRDFAHVLNAGPRGKAAVLAVGFSLVAVPLGLLLPWAGLLFGFAAIGALAAIERGFLALTARSGGLALAATAIPVLWLHYLMSGAGYARVRLLG